MYSYTRLCFPPPPPPKKKEGEGRNVVVKYRNRAPPFCFPVEFKKNTKKSLCCFLTKARMSRRCSGELRSALVTATIYTRSRWREGVVEGGGGGARDVCYVTAPPLFQFSSLSYTHTETVSSNHWGSDIEATSTWTFGGGGGGKEQRCNNLHITSLSPVHFGMSSYLFWYQGGRFSALDLSFFPFFSLFLLIFHQRGVRTAAISKEDDGEVDLAHGTFRFGECLWVMTSEAQG